MKHKYSDNMVKNWGGMKEMTILIDKTEISKKLLELGLPEGKTNNSIDAISIIESLRLKFIYRLKCPNKLAVKHKDQWYEVAGSSNMIQFKLGFSTICFKKITCS